MKYWPLYFFISLGWLSSVNAKSVDKNFSHNNQPAQSHLSQLPNLNLLSLMDQSQLNLQDLNGSLVILSFYENECRWCLKQMRQYNQLVSNNEVKFVMAGIGSNDFYLRHWANRANPQFPVVKANKNLLDIVGKIEATPYTLIFDQQGRFITKITGYIEAAKIEKIIKILS
ncbi:TlpA family protein disulfide reductase [Aliikangiella sp. IMCC44359]|uniref:TlpA family protein disulfide reductase n=1 Tax=Aliikangiella sp. IMCC44359 TaxID=3459125 RepID=UPI00403A81D2